MRAFPSVFRNDTAIAATASVVMAFAVTRLLFLVDSAPWLTLLLAAVPGYVTGLWIRGDRVRTHLPPLLAGSIVFGILAPIFAIGLPRSYNHVSGTWHIDVHKFIDKEYVALLGAVAFVFLMAGLLAVVAKGAAKLSPRYLRFLPHAVLVAAALAAVLASSDGIKKERIERAVEAAAHCREDADCEDIGGYLDAGLGCFVSVNRHEAERMRKFLSLYVTNDIAHCTNAPRPPITCRQNRCGAWVDDLPHVKVQ